ncbi:2-oxo acid dehydrogenase subunit E2 [Candidatus Micrarchaeota archaeon]|nr:2-oxo acid dehydrogenase subunit E2 [Candidatus Micrarchaeota archaeon]
MVEFIYFADVGEGIHEGKLVKWLVKEGDSVKEDLPLAEIETDKAIVEIPSSKNGVVLKLYGKPGDTLKVGDALVALGEKGEKVPEPKTLAEQPTQQKQTGQEAAEQQPQQQTKTQKPTQTQQLQQKQKTQTTTQLQQTRPQQTQQKQTKTEAAQQQLAQKQKTQPQTATQLQQAPQLQPQQTQPPAKTTGRILAPPSVRKLAREMGIDLSTVRGSWPDGRITAGDVRKAKEAPQPVQATAVRRRSYIVSKPGGPEIRKQFTNIRKMIAEKLSYSHQLPHLTHVDEADVTSLWELRQKEKKRAEDKGVKLTLLPFVIKATVKALKEFPDFNSSLDEEKDEVILKKYYHIGVAVDTPNGLMVPVLRDADRKSVFDIAKEITILSTKAKARPIKLDELSGSTFSITNIGSVGGIYATPLINPPEAAILGVMRMQTRPAFAPIGKEKKAKSTKAGRQAGKETLKVEARQFLPLCLTFDHRLNDGAADLNGNGRPS